MKRFLLISILILVAGYGIAQSGAKNTSVPQNFGSYNRSGITWIFANSGQAYSSEMSNALSFENMVIPDKFDDNRISGYELKSSSKKSEVLKSNKIAGKVMLNFFDKEGSISQKTKDRAKYTMTDAEYTQFSASNDGTDIVAVRKLADKILASNFIVAFDYSNIKTMEKYYDEIDAANREKAKKNKDYKFEPVQRRNVGYMGSVTLEVYKIVYNDSIANEFWTSCLENGKLNYSKALNFNFPLEYKTSKTIGLDGNVSKEESAQKKYTDKDYFNMMTSSGYFSGFLAELETMVDEFKVRTGIYGTKPISAKIGLKEGVTPNRRFYVFELVMDEAGNKKIKRRGVVRATKKVTDNRNVSQGDMEPSKFYQIQGRKLDVGMMMEEKKDLGTLNLGYGNAGLYVKADFLSFTTAGRTYIDFDYKGYKFDEDKITIDGEEKSTDAAFFDIGLGFSQDIHFAHNFFAGGLGGIRFYGASFKDDKLSDLVEEAAKKEDVPYGQGKVSVKLGARIGMYVSPRFKVIGSLMYAPTKFADDDVFGKDSGTDTYIKPPSVRFNLGIAWDVNF